MGTGSTLSHFLAAHLSERGGGGENEEEKRKRRKRKRSESEKKGRERARGSGRKRGKSRRMVRVEDKRGRHCNLLISYIRQGPEVPAEAVVPKGHPQGHMRRRLAYGCAAQVE